MPDRAVADDLADVRPAAAWLEAQLSRAALTEAQRHDVHVCVEEALANLILHARPLHVHKDIRLSVTANASDTDIVIRDACVPFDSVAHSARDRLDGAALGGHGLSLLRALAHELRYESAPEGNALHMIFRFAAAKDDVAAGLGTIPAFARLPVPALAALASACLRRVHAKGDVLIRQGADGGIALALLEGSVSVFHESAHGEAPLASIAAPALFGEIAAIAGLHRTASIRAETNVRLAEIPRAALLDAARHDPDLLAALIGQLGQQIQTINRALGLYAAGLTALGEDRLDAGLLSELSHPAEELRSFSSAFHGLAEKIEAERRSRKEMANAAAIQEAMLPPPLDPARLAGRGNVQGLMHPARAVGGDFYDMALIGPDTLALAIGDVCGKGIPAALFMSMTVTALRIAVRGSGTLSERLARANDAVAAQNAAGMFATLFYAEIDLRSRKLAYVNAGHNPPFLLRAGKALELNTGGPPLGLFEGTHWAVEHVDMHPNDGLFLFTDGLTECINASGEEFGTDRLAALLSVPHAAHAPELVARAASEAAAHSAGMEAFDDLTCLCAFLA